MGVWYLGVAGVRAMMSVLAFLCRMLVFEVLSLLSTTAARGYDLSLFERVIVSTVQVLVFA